ncbi:hypothetical protein [Halochromatium salexigens]|uniref:Uncharacterized protein n=1 Tax=Halochromatium salexigens TaxID=49447 RepID=A0AAJ0UDE9_HALSE|nr:hypothetical protein [Halochromatium salexigens]MBK5929441.1 hypothetical protein [Halochromatium salexigens]
MSTKPKEPRKRKWRYIFWRGAVFWGISTALLYQAMMLFFGNVSLVGFIVSMIAFPLAGIFFGLLMWRRSGTDL